MVSATGNCEYEIR